MSHGVFTLAKTETHLESKTDSCAEKVTLDVNTVILVINGNNIGN